MRLEPLQSRRSGADLAFSLSLSLSFSPQNFPAAGVGDRRCISLCFLAIRFHARVVILTSIKSHFWSSLGHRGHCCVFVVVFGLFGTQSSTGCHFFLLCRHFCGMFTCSSSGGRTATATGLPCAAVRRRSSLLPHSPATAASSVRRTELPSH